MPAQSINGNQITIVGAGTWGTTLAWMYGESGKQVRLWDRNSDKIRQLQKAGIVEKPLHMQLSKNVHAFEELKEAIRASSVIIFAVTSQSMREIAMQMSSVLSGSADTNIMLISAVKGLEIESSKTISQVINECVPGYSVAALSGPNLAVEILQKKPAASVVACTDEQLAKSLQSILSAPNFRVYASTDLIGVELGGALKNIIAIAAGCADGMGLGANARAAILTRGLAEMNRLSSALGARTETLSGLSGMGDLITTCTSPLSRNHRLGILIAQGKNLKEALEELSDTAEGVPTCEAVCKLAKRIGIDLPIAGQVELVLKGEATPQDAIMNLMSRPLVRE